MEIINLISELQKNPLNPVVFRKLANYYLKNNRTNEHQSFLELINKKFNVTHHSNIDQK